MSKWHKRHPSSVEVLAFMSGVQAFMSRVQKAWSKGDKPLAKRAGTLTFAGCASKFGYSPLRVGRVRRGQKARGNDIMSASLLRAAGLAAVAVFAVVAVDSAREQVAPGLHAEEYQSNPKPKVRRHVRRQARQETVEAGSSPAGIAHYFQQYGGYIDPYVNKQSPGGPFDSGFFFDSGIGPNGGDSPYMN